MESDFAISLDDNSARFRVNVFRQRGEVSMVLRRIPSKIPTIDEMGLPEILKSLVMHKRGLILMVGATGSGKSTTLAAMINERNQKMAGHILTIEDPIEFSHPNGRSIVNQRELGVDTLSYRAALRASLREAPDVILIGEIRDRETMEAALELCNTGHLCMSTLHANNANQAMDRVINLFPQDLHKQLYLDLSMNLRAVISQRLVPKQDGKGRQAAVEIMLNTPLISDLIFKSRSLSSQLSELSRACLARRLKLRELILQRTQLPGQGLALAIKLLESFVLICQGFLHFTATEGSSDAFACALVRICNFLGAFLR